VHWSASDAEEAAERKEEYTAIRAELEVEITRHLKPDKEQEEA
jgi:hypothetical protein